MTMDIKQRGHTWNIKVIIHFIQKLFKIIFDFQFGLILFFVNIDISDTLIVFRYLNNPHPDAWIINNLGIFC